MLREKGVTESEGIGAYDSMCAFMRKISSISYKAVDLLPNGYKIVRQSLKDDLEGEKRICWDTEILQSILYPRLVCTWSIKAPLKIYKKVNHCRKWNGMP